MSTVLRRRGRREGVLRGTLPWRPVPRLASCQHLGLSRVSRPEPGGRACPGPGWDSERPSEFARQDSPGDRALASVGATRSASPLLLGAAICQAQATDSAGAGPRAWGEGPRAAALRLLARRRRSESCVFKFTFVSYLPVDCAVAYGRIRSESGTVVRNVPCDRARGCGAKCWSEAARLDAELSGIVEELRSPTVRAHGPPGERRLFMSWCSNSFFSCSSLPLPLPRPLPLQFRVPTKTVTWTRITKTGSICASI